MVNDLDSSGANEILAGNLPCHIRCNSNAFTSSFSRICSVSSARSSALCDIGRGDVVWMLVAAKDRRRDSREIFLRAKDLDHGPKRRWAAPDFVNCVVNVGETSPLPAAPCQRSKSKREKTAPPNQLNLLVVRELPIQANGQSSQPS